MRIVDYETSEGGVNNLTHWPRGYQRFLYTIYNLNCSMRVSVKPRDSFAASDIFSRYQGIPDDRNFQVADAGSRAPAFTSIGRGLAAGCGCGHVMRTRTFLLLSTSRVSTRPSSRF